MANKCPGNEGLVRRYRDKSRYVACAVCEKDLTDPKDLFADWTGGRVEPHERAQNEPGLVVTVEKQAV